MASLFLACNGEGAAQAMNVSEHFGYYAAAFCGAVAVLLLALDLRRRDFAWLPVYGPLLLVHPAWTMSVYIGDCGYGKRFFSVAICVVFFALLLCRVTRAQVSAVSFAILLCGIGWVAYCTSQLVRWRPDTIFRVSSLSGVSESEAFQAFMLASSRLFSVALGLSLMCIILYLYHRAYGRRTGV